MKQLIILLIINLLFAPQPAHAGFIMKHNAVVINNTVSALETRSIVPEQKNSTEHFPAKNYSCFNRVSWVGYAALMSAVVGLFVPAFSIITILFGILGMTRGCRADRLATLAMIAGIGELVLFLLTNSAVLVL